MPRTLQELSFGGIVNTLFRFYATTKEHFDWGALRMIGGVGSEIFAVLSGYLSGRMAGVALDGDLQVLARYAAVLVAAVLGRSLLAYGNEWTGQKYSVYSGEKLYSLAIEKINRLPINYYDNERTGDTASRLTNNFASLKDYYGNSVAGKISIPIGQASKNRQEGMAGYNSYVRDFVEGIEI